MDKVLDGDLIPQVKDGQRYSNFPTSVAFLFSNESKWERIREALQLDGILCNCCSAVPIAYQCLTTHVVSYLFCVGLALKCFS